MQYVDTNISLETNVDWLDNGELVNEIVLNRPMQQIAAIYNGNFQFIDQELPKKLNIGDGGINGKSIITNDVDNLVRGGIYFGYGGTHFSPSSGNNPFPDFPGAFSLFQAGNNFDLNSPSYNSQIAISQGNNKLKFRSISSSNYTNWATVLTDEDIQLGDNVPILNGSGNKFNNGHYFGLGTYYSSGWKAKESSQGAGIFRNGGENGFELLVSNDVTTKDQPITGINVFYFKDGEITNNLNNRTFWHDISLPIVVDANNYTFDRSIQINASGTIAGTDFNAGHLKIGDSNTGIAFDTNEMVMFGSNTFTINNTTDKLNISASNIIDINAQKLQIRMDQNVFAEFNTSNIQFKRNIQSTHNIEAGVGSGSVALTTNDGYGNANLTFNHAFGVPDVDGNSGRIHVNVDDSSNARMKFMVASGVTSGVTANLVELLKLEDSGAYFKGYKIYHANDKPTPAELGAAVENHVHDEYIMQNSDVDLLNLYINNLIASKIDNTTYMQFPETGKIRFVASGVQKMILNSQQLLSDVDIVSTENIRTKKAISVEGTSNKCEMVFDNNSNSLNFNFS